MTTSSHETLQHRIQAAERESFGLPDPVRVHVESILDFARDALTFGDPDFSEAWDSLFEAEERIRQYEKALSVHLISTLGDES